MTDHTYHRYISVSRRRRLTISVIVVVFIIFLATFSILGGHRLSSAFGEATSGDAIRMPAPNGLFTTTSDHNVHLASYISGHPTMVWFIAGGCASCAASIPAVSMHMRELARDGIQVVTLGLYGAFPPGRQGVVDLARFRIAAGGLGVIRPGWTWGVASKALSLKYDLLGTPDEYFLVASNGRIAYKNSVPVSTMPSLLAAAKRISAVQGSKRGGQ